jgi:PAS domain S-box-containing protein
MRPAAKPLDRPERMPVAEEPTNIIALRPLAANQNAAASRGDDPSGGTLALTLDEQNAFHAIAFSLGAKLTDQGGQRGQAPGDEKGLAPESANISAAAAAPHVGLPGASVVGAGAAEAFVDNRDMFRDIVDLLPIGILVCHDRAPVFANCFLLDLLGYADLDLAIAAGALERIVNGMARRARQGESVELRDGAGNPISLRADRRAIDWCRRNAELVTLRPHGGTSLEAERRRAESEARELNAILDTAMDGVAVLDLQGRIVTLNRSGEALFGYDQSEVAGEPFAMLIAPESRSRAQDYFEGLKSNGVVSLLNDGREIMGLARQGGAIPLFMTLGRISAGDPWDCGPEHEQEVRFCALLRDMTHWKKVERDLDEARRAAERASALKSDFLAKVSHEIRTPLNAILGFAEVIMDERFGPIGNERYKDYLKDIHSSGALVMSLVNDLLDLSKIEAGKMELDFALVDANRIVSECVSIMQPLASRERVILRLSLAAGLPHVVADERSLRQIVLNLLSNAVKFNQPGGQVIVATALTESGHAVLRIRDTGVGMSEDEIEIALEPFRQLATSRPSGGTGLGLPLTKALVEANRAFFSIKSKKHEGTLVEVAFPPARVLAK